MKPVAVAVLALALTGSAPAFQPAPWATLAFSRSPEAGGGVYLFGRGQLRLLAAGAFEPSWSPDGRRIAYAARADGVATDLFVVDADGSHRGRLTRTATVDEASPAWSPDGKRLAVDRGGRIVVLRADGAGERVVGDGWEPAWSPRGRRIAFVRNDDLYVVSAKGGRARQVLASTGAQRAPAWALDGSRIAFISDESGFPDVYVLDLQAGIVTRLTADPAVETSPIFTANGRGVVYVSDLTGVETLWRVPATGGKALPTAVLPLASDTAMRPAPRIVELLPDLEQRPPADLSVKTERRHGRPHFLLGFDSATDNVGLGPIVISAQRTSRSNAAMNAAQVVRTVGGGPQRYRRVGVLRYVHSSAHSHWHVMGFQRYELRRASDYAILVRDRKSGFCLADHWAHAPGRFLNEPRRPVFTGYCERGRPEALSVDQGTSVGYTDRYPSHFHGQNLDVTSIPDGTYVLVHRANRSFLLHELRYENNAASVRIRISWPHGRSRPPAVRVIRTCPDSDRC